MSYLTKFLKLHFPFYICQNLTKMFFQVEWGHWGLLALKKHCKAHVGTNTGISSKKMRALK